MITEKKNGGAYIMEVGLVGLGKMGFNLALNLYEHGVQVIRSYDFSDEARKKLNRKEGIQTCSCIKKLVEKLSGKRIIWLMVPSGEITESCISEIKELLKKDDIVIDAGNSNYKDSMRRAMEFQQKRNSIFTCWYFRRNSRCKERSLFNDWRR